MRRIPFILLCSIIVLAGFGLAIQLFSEPIQLVTSLIKTFIVAGLIFAIVYFLFFRSKQTNTSSKKYKQAVKQSQKKYGKPNRQHINKMSSKAPNRNIRRKASHLRVIEGNKSKKDDHASN